MNAFRRKSTADNNNATTASNSQQQQQQSSSTGNTNTNSTNSTGAMLAKDKTCRRIEQMELEREERRRAMIERKKLRNEEEQRNIAAGNPGDVDFIGMVRTWRSEHCNDAVQLDGQEQQQPHPRICICVRKRPITEKEIAKNDHDCITIYNPVAWVHSPKTKVDGISKYLDHTSFTFDYTFDEKATTDNVYTYTAMPLIDFICTGNGGRATIFAYGQTGSGKTHTMNGIQQLVSEDLFLLLSERALDSDTNGCSIDDTSVTISFFELYGGHVQDLLNNQNRLKVLEDGKGEIQIPGLSEHVAYDPATFLRIIADGNNARTTHTTEANDTSSRSHAICQILLKDRYTNKLRGKLSLVDLAGSERGSDTKAHNQQRRAESADINTSLLSLKECIRALDQQQQTGSAGGSNSNKKPSSATGSSLSTTNHVPYRGSKLTLILKDCFTASDAMTTMIATISPGSSSADHSINTLRYADRIKSHSSNSNNSNAAAAASNKGATVSKVQTATTNLRNRRSMTTSLSSSNPGLKESRNETTSGTTKDAKTNTSSSSKQQQQRQQQEEDEQQQRKILEAEFRKTVEAIYEQEEIILSTHMANIQENAELLTVEGDLLSVIQQHQGDQTLTKGSIDEYVTALEEILDRKEDMILNLQQHVTIFQNHLTKEKELAKQMGNASLPQY